MFSNHSSSFNIRLELGHGCVVFDHEVLHGGLERCHGGAGRHQLALHFTQLFFVRGLLLVPLQLLRLDLFFFLLLEAVVEGTSLLI